MTKRRITAVGLDAASFDYLKERADQGTMPNFAALMESSLRCRLENTVEYRSELSWTTFVTGRTGPSINYWTTVGFDPETYETGELGAYPGAPFWSSLPVRRPIAFDMPHSTLGDHPGLVQVNAWGAHSGQFPRSASPAGLLREIDARFGPHPAFEADYESCWHQPDYVEDLTDALVAGAHRRADICRWLMDRYPDWDLFLTVMSEPHSVGHHCWHGIDPTHPLHGHPLAAHSRRAMERVHAAVDEALGSLRQAAGEDTVFVVFAVHGMANNTNDIPAAAIVPELLYRLQFDRTGLANPTRLHGARTDGMFPLPPGYTNRYLSRLFGDDRTSRLKRDLWRYTPPALQRLRWELRAKLTGKPPRGFPRVSDFDAPPEAEGDNAALLAMEAGEQSFHGPVLYQQHWPRMRAFALPTFSDAHIRLNVAGRERHGIVAPEDYHRACDEIIGELRALRDLRDGSPVLKEVIKLREADPMDPDGPSADLAVLFDRPVAGCSHPRAGRLGPYPTFRTGEHDNRGFVMVSGPGIRPDELHLHSALDVPATIIALASDGEPVQEELDGRPLLSSTELVV